MLALAFDGALARSASINRCRAISASASLRTGFTVSMRSLSRAQRNGAAAALSCCLAAAIFCPVRSAAQEAESYLRGERKRLLITVHVLGEVRTPGEYSVPDD